jgi:hypothetical protein
VKRFKFNFGPATKISIVAVVGILIWQWVTQPPSTPIADLRSRVTNEAPPPLRKPEPRELLVKRLTDSQRKQIEEISRSWEAEKKSLLASLTEASSSKPDGSDLDSLKASFTGYAELSRLYNIRREEAWQRALAAVNGAVGKEDAS